MTHDAPHSYGYVSKGLAVPDWFIDATPRAPAAHAELLKARAELTEAQRVENEAASAFTARYLASAAGIAARHPKAPTVAQVVIEPDSPSRAARITAERRLNVVQRALDALIEGKSLSGSELDARQREAAARTLRAQDRAELALDELRDALADRHRAVHLTKHPSGSHWPEAELLQQCRSEHLNDADTAARFRRRGMAPPLNGQPVDASRRGRTDVTAGEALGVIRRVLPELRAHRDGTA
jgi:hypothetical protein